MNNINLKLIISKDIFFIFHIEYYIFQIRYIKLRSLFEQFQNRRQQNQIIKSFLERKILSLSSLHKQTQMLRRKAMTPSLKKSFSKKTVKVYNKNESHRLQIHLPPLTSYNKSKLSKFRQKDEGHSQPVNKFSHSRFLGYDNKGYEEKISEKIPIIQRQQYQYVSTSQINKQFSTLKEELKIISQQLSRYISTKGPRQFLHHSPSQYAMNKSQVSQFEYSPSNIKAGFEPGNTSNPPAQNTSSNLYQRFQQNNSQIRLNQNAQLQKLLQRQSYIVENNPFQLKQVLKQQISELKQELRSQNKVIKKMVIQSEKIGEDILQTDKLVEDIRSLEDQLSVIMDRKRKLKDQVQVNAQRRKIVDDGKAGIYEKQYDLGEYQAENRIVNKQNQLKSTYQEELKRKQRIIAALRKDIQARTKIKTKQYYDLLSQLNTLEEKSEQISTKYDHFQEKILATGEQYEKLKVKYQQMQRTNPISKFKHTKNPSNPQKSKTQSVNPAPKQDTRTSFYKSKHNLDMNQTQPHEVLKQIEDNLQKTQKLSEMENKSSPKNVGVCRISVDNLEKENQSHSKSKQGKTERQIKDISPFITEQNYEDEYDHKDISESVEEEEEFRQILSENDDNQRGLSQHSLKVLKDEQKKAIPDKNNSKPSAGNFKKYQKLTDEQIIEQDQKYAIEQSYHKKSTKKNSPHTNRNKEIENEFQDVYVEKEFEEEILV